MVLEDSDLLEQLDCLDQVGHLVYLEDRDSKGHGEQLAALDQLDCLDRVAFLEVLDFKETQVSLTVSVVNCD